MEDSIVKDVKGWKLSDKKDKTLNITVEQKWKAWSLISFPLSKEILLQLPCTLGLTTWKALDPPEEISWVIINLMTYCKTQTDEVILSNEKKNKTPEIFVLLIIEIFFQNTTVLEVGYI